MTVGPLPRPAGRPGAGRALTGERARRRLGLLAVIAAALVFSTAGLFTRLIGADTWTVLFWRGLLGGVSIGAFVAWRHRAGTPAAFAAVGRPGCVAALCMTAGVVSFIAALRLTAVAHVAIIYATAPLLTALVARLWSGERASPATLAASLAAVAGVAVMVGGGPGTGDARGDLLALAMTLAMAVMMVVLRGHREVPMVPAACLSAWLTALVSWPMAAPLRVSGEDFLYLALFGAVQMGLGYVLLTVGSQLVPPVENALVGALDAPLAPLWVWLAFGEAPTAAALAGGAVVLAAVVGHALAGSLGPSRSGGEDRTSGA
jgi:drug/metabolite transporter (DMT)-like permease